MNIINAKEDLLIMALGITPDRRGRWCRPVEPGFLAELNRRKPTSMEAFARLWYARSGGTSSDWRRCAEQHYDSSRYHLLNLHATFSTERPAHTIEFRAFNGTLNPDAIKAYIQLCLAISAQALSSKAASPTRPVTDNPKYTFRCWLLRLGFIGETNLPPHGNSCSSACPATRLGGGLPDTGSLRTAFKSPRLTIASGTGRRPSASRNPETGSREPQLPNQARRYTP